MTTYIQSKWRKHYSHSTKHVQMHNIAWHEHWFSSISGLYNSLWKQNTHGRYPAVFLRMTIPVCFPSHQSLSEKETICSLEFAPLANKFFSFTIDLFQKRGKHQTELPVLKVHSLPLTVILANDYQMKPPTQMCIYDNMQMVSALYLI